jgi:hypothetical protein
VGDLMPRDQRLYMTFPNDIHRHPKLVRLSVEARWAFIEMNGEARLSDNDGVFTADEALFHWSEAILTELCGSHPTRPLVARDGDGGYRIRDYSEHQQTRAERERLAEVSRENGRKGGRPKVNPWGTQTKPTETQGVPGETQTKAEIEKELEKEKEEIKSISTPTARGTRLSDSWLPSSELIEWARIERSDIDPVKEADAFRDYWLSQPGQKGVKTDWDRTFKNWIRNARGRGGSKSAPAMPADRMQATLALATPAWKEIA